MCQSCFWLNMISTMNKLNELASAIHKSNVERGFYEHDRNHGEIIALIHSELSEALEADRKGIRADSGDLDDLMSCSDRVFKPKFEATIKDTLEDELADAVIRILDMCAYLGIDIDAHIALKMRYNSMRPYKHGKKY